MPNTKFGTDQSALNRILSQLTPLIITNVQKSLNSSDYKKPLGSKGIIYQNDKQSSGFISEGSSDNQLVERILLELSPFIEGAIARYFSNQNLSQTNSQPDFYVDSSEDINDQQLVNTILTELLPTIQMIIKGKLSNETENRKNVHTPFFNGK